jgi:hypothetical protein
LANHVCRLEQDWSNFNRGIAPLQPKTSPCQFACSRGPRSFHAKQHRSCFAGTIQASNSLVSVPENILANGEPPHLSERPLSAAPVSINVTIEAFLVGVLNQRPSLFNSALQRTFSEKPILNVKINTLRDGWPQISLRIKCKRLGTKTLTADKITSTKSLLKDLPTSIYPAEPSPLSN